MELLWWPVYKFMLELDAMEFYYLSDSTTLLNPTWFVLPDLDWTVVFDLTHSDPTVLESTLLFDLIYLFDFIR